MAPVLTVISDFVGILGGWVVARFQLQVTSGLYWSSVTKGLYMQDVWMGLIKPFVFGFVIVTIACHVGLRTTGGTAGVGKVDDRLGRRRIGGGDRVRLLRHPDPDCAAVLMQGTDRSTRPRRRS